MPEHPPDYSSLSDAALRQYHDLAQEVLDEEARGRTPRVGDTAEWRLHIRGIEAELARRGLTHAPLPLPDPRGDATAG